MSSASRSLGPTPPTPGPPSPASSATRVGVLYALAAYGCWGLIPLYWKAARHVDAGQVVAHRTLWGLVVALLLLAWTGRLRQLGAVLRDGRSVLLLTCSALLLAANWSLFVWAIQGDQVLESSLGYYVNPLVNVLLGVLVLGERLRPRQALAVLIAAVAVTLLSVALGTPPWIALGLAVTFGLYGLLRKVARVEALVGLGLETALLAPLALAYLLHAEILGRGAFLHVSGRTDLLLVGSGVVTTIPLLWFAHAARRLRYATLGQFQYITPTGHFLLAVLLWDEPLSAPRVGSFALIGVALLLYASDALRSAREP